ncbi:sensor histidine kinase [Sphingobium aromaticiconvertens]|uniref:sensor histidine kinase n=1 Tax=Sphingobium aromaticiconvertens TaxID=365341 RepID=UPI00301AD7C1
MTPATALVEVIVNILDGGVHIGSPDLILEIIGVIRPTFAYGIAVAFTRWLSGGVRASILLPPMPFGLATIVAPLLAAIAALSELLIRPDMIGVTDARSIMLALTAFTVGDLLGVLVVAPPLLWLIDVATGRTALPRTLPALAVVAEAMLVLTCGMLFAGVLQWLGFRPQPMPLALAVAWIGLRFGRSAAWGAMMVVVLLLLPHTAGAIGTMERLQIHLGLATVMVVGYLAGSFADAQTRARADLARRDRLLFQAERLKTLRAMSVAVIHEISQPLSTLAIEARHLHAITGDADPDIAASAALIDRKAEALSTLVRRLRRFGGRTVDEPTPLPLTVLIDSVISVVSSEAKAAGTALVLPTVNPDLVVMAQEVELVQALVNLLRNAIQASHGGRVTLTVSQDAMQVRLTISNPVAPDRLPQPGMGVGTLVARAILVAHGGTLTRDTDDQGIVHARLALPRIAEAAMTGDDL